jgi:glucose-1-phosphate cytidylyltransferase
MKVVLFCGGLGLRIRDYSEETPKPMIAIGYRPILWHVMKYYAHFGHREFILALGYKSEAIKQYFLNYEECTSNNFILEEGGARKTLLHSDIHDWRITFVDTGLLTPIGERLLRVKEYVGEDETFLANYTDSLTDCPLPQILAHVQRHGKKSGFLCVKPPLSYHVVSTTNGGTVSRIEPIKHSALRINGGFFVLHRSIFDVIKPGEELVEEPFQRLIERRDLVAYRYDGFWASMDTLKDKQRLEEMHAQGTAPWEVWRGGAPTWFAEVGANAAVGG